MTRWKLKTNIVQPVPYLANMPPFKTILSKIGGAVTNALSSSATYQAPPPVAQVPTQAGVVTPDPYIQKGLQSAYSLYPEVPKGLIEAVMMQESSMGKNLKNKKADAGQYGYLGGITKTGIFSDMTKNSKIPYGAWKVEGAKDLSTPHGAIAVIGSILAQHIRNNYGGKISPEQVLELYDKYYKTREGNSLSPKQKQQFLTYFQHYSKLST